MGTVRLPGLSVATTSEVAGVRASGNIFAAENQATRGIVALIKDVQNDVLNKWKEMEDIEDQSQYADAVSADQDSWGKFELSTNQTNDYASLMGSFEKWQTEHKKNMWGSVKSLAAKRAILNRINANEGRRRTSVRNKVHNMQVDATEAKMPERINGLLQAGYTDAGSADNPDDARLLIENARQDATDYIDRLGKQEGNTPALLDPKAQAFWKNYMAGAEKDILEQVAEREQASINEQLFKNAMAQGGTDEAQLWINSIPADQIDKADRSELMSRVGRQFELLENQKVRDQDSMYSDMFKSATQDDLAPLTIDSALRTDIIRQEQWTKLKKMTEPSSVEFQLDAYSEVKQVMSDYRNGRDAQGKQVTQADVELSIANNKGKLTAAHAKALVDEMYQVDTESDPLKSDGAKSGVSVLSNWRNKGLFTEGDITDDDQTARAKAIADNDKIWLDKLSDFQAWAAENPNATSGDTRQYFDTVAPDLNFGTTRNLKQGFRNLLLGNVWGPVVNMFQGVGRKKELTPEQQAPIIKRFIAIPLSAKRGYVDAKNSDPDILVQDYMATWRKELKSPTLADQVHYLQISDGDTQAAENKMQADGFITGPDTINP